MSEKKKILVIDDEPSILYVVINRLQASGYTVVTAYDGFNGLETLEKENVDLILLDIMMPKMDGFQFLKELKKVKKGNKVPVIMFSAKVQDEDVRKAKDLGASDFISKPFTPDILLEKIKNALNMKSSA